MVITFPVQSTATISGVAFPAMVESTPFVCEVSLEALQDIFSGVGKDPVQVFEQNRSKIEDVAQQLIVRGAKSKVYIRVGDFPA